MIVSQLTFHICTVGPHSVQLVYIHPSWSAGPPRLQLVYNQEWPALLRTLPYTASFTPLFGYLIHPAASLSHPLPSPSNVSHPLCPCIPFTRQSPNAFLCTQVCAYNQTPSKRSDVRRASSRYEGGG
jgi:hypothetical protein